MSIPTPRPILQKNKGRRQVLTNAAALALAPSILLLTGCGGGDTSEAEPPTTPLTPKNPGGPDPRNASPDRTMTINITNHAQQSLTFGMPVRQGKSSLPHAQPSSIAEGETCAVIASSSHTDCNGTFRMASPSTRFDFRYIHPHGPGETNVFVTASNGYLACANAQKYAGHHAIAHLNLYRGVPTLSGQSVVPLGLLEAPAFNNAQDFVNSLYTAGVREESVIKAAHGDSDPVSGLAPIADFTGGQLPHIASLWTKHWLGQETNSLPSADGTLIGLLRQYIDTASGTGPLRMWVPQIRQMGDASPPVYALDGYRPYAFRTATGSWDGSAVGTFLKLLAGGAHFVAICANADLPDGTRVLPFDRFLASSGVSLRYDIGSSHYATIVNTTGHYYLNISGNFAPENCGLLLAFLSGRTVNNATADAGQYNSFIQLEGWQAGAGRHNADYALHTRTLWNISTFGASAYSEKRGTTVFLAPAGWTPQLYQTTCMMPYLGAYASAAQQAQSWLRRDLVTIPDNTPELPSRYIAP